MSDPRDIRDDLEPGAEDAIVTLGQQLLDGRPLPSPAFCGGLRRHLVSRSGRLAAPARLRSLIAAYAGAGTLLLAAGALSAAGLGPLG